MNNDIPYIIEFNVRAMAKLREASTEKGISIILKEGQKLVLLRTLLPLEKSSEWSDIEFNYRDGDFKIPIKPIRPGQIGYIYPDNPPGGKCTHYRCHQKILKVVFCK